jgi:hypothetical protein
MNLIEYKIVKQAMSNAILIHRANTKSSVRQYGPRINAKVGSDALEE